MSVLIFARHCVCIWCAYCLGHALPDDINIDYLVTLTLWLRCPWQCHIFFTIKSSIFHVKLFANQLLQKKEKLYQWLNIFKLQLSLNVHFVIVTLIGFVFPVCFRLCIPLHHHNCISDNQCYTYGQQHVAGMCLHHWLISFNLNGYEF